MPKDPYYTASEARRVLGNINPNRLKRYVDSGILNRYPAPGNTIGKYLRSEVDALAERIRRYEEGETDNNGRGTAHHSHRSQSFAG